MAWHAGGATSAENVDEDEILGKSYDGKLMSRFVPYVKPYSRVLSISLVFLLVTSALDQLGPDLIGYAIDRFVSPASERTKNGVYSAFDWVFQALHLSGMAGVLEILLFALTLSFVLKYVMGYMLQWIGQRVMYDLRTQIFTHLERLNLQFFDKNPVGRLMSRLTGDVDSLNDLVTQGVVSILGDGITLVVIVVFMLVLDWKLALFGLAVLPPMVLIANVFQKAMRRIYRRIRVRLSRINGYLNENITGMSIVQLFNRERKMFESFDELNQSYRTANLQAIFAYSLFSPIVIFMGALGTGLLLWFGGSNLKGWGVQPGVMVAMIVYTNAAFQPIRDLADKFTLLQAAMAGAERIFGLLDEVQEPPDVPNPVVLDTVRGDIQFRNVVFGYDPANPVLKDVSFKINAGESVAIVGATGAGKTSMISIMSRFYDIQGGQILLDGVDIRDMRRSDVRRHIGTVLQDPVLFSGTIKSNIRLHSDEVTDEQVRRAAMFVNADRFIDQLPDGYDSEVRERGANFSAGQRQLIAFARAIAFDPEVLLVLDEATSSVDTETESLIQDALERLMNNRTSIIIAHRLFTIRHVDRIIVLHKGKLVEQGTHDDLLAQQGFYHRLYELQYQEQEDAALVG
jgi:ATP-binding cassette subfamily B multidrug efflux pump